jgi:hypothetical protein
MDLDLKEIILEQRPEQRRTSSLYLCKKNISKNSTSNLTQPELKISFCIVHRKLQT